MLQLEWYLKSSDTAIRHDALSTQTKPIKNILVHLLLNRDTFWFHRTLLSWKIMLSLKPCVISCYVTECVQLTYLPVVSWHFWIGRVILVNGTVIAKPIFYVYLMKVSYCNLICGNSVAHFQCLHLIKTAGNSFCYYFRVFPVAWSIL